MSFKVIRSEWKIYALLASVAGILAYHYFLTVDFGDASCRAFRMQTHQQILEGRLDYHYRYRVLVPFLTEMLIRPLATGMAPFKAFFLSYLFYDFAAIFFLLATLYLYLREWFPSLQSFVAVLFCACTMLLALKDHCYQPMSLLEVSFFSLGLLAMRRKYYGWLAFITIGAVLNRETGVFIPLLFGLTSVTHAEKKTWGLFCFYLLLAALTYMGLRFFMGDVSHPGETLGFLGLRGSFGAVWNFNRVPLNFRTAVIQTGLFFGLFWAFIFFGYRCTASPFLRRAVWMCLPYLLLHGLYSCWYEVRALMTLYPVLVPLGLSYFNKKGDLA